MLYSGRFIVTEKRPVYWIYVALLADIVLFFHKPLFSSAYMLPWDFRGVQLPPMTFLADQLRQGHFALWNPYVYDGFPVFANIEACYFHPLVLLSAWIAAHTSMDALPMLLEWSAVLHIWVGGIAAFHLFRRLGAGRAAAFAGAVIFQTGGFFPSRAQHIVSFLTVAWMPLAWLAVLHLAEARSRRWIAILAAALGMSVLGGFPADTVVVFVSTCVFALLLLAFRQARRTVVAPVAVACALGLLLGAVILLPTTQLTENSVAKYRVDWLGTGGGLFPQTLVSLVLPNHYNIFDPSIFHGPGDLTFLYQYCSIAGLLLALYAAIRIREWQAWMLGALSVFGIFWMLGDKTAPWRWVFPLLPEKIRIGIHPEYAYCLLTIGIAGLAALGLARLRVRESIRWGIAIVIALDLYLVGSGRPMNVVSVQQEPGVTRDAFDGNRELLNGVRSRTQFDTPPSRIDTVDASMFWAVGGTVTGVPSANGVSPLAPDLIIQLRLFLHDGFRWGWYYPLEKLDSPVLDLLNARWILVGPKAVDRVRAVPRFRHVATLPGNELFENTTVLPRFFLVHQVQLAGSLAEARAIVDRREIDFAKTAIAEEPIPLPPAASGVDDVKVIDYQPNSLELAVTSRGAGLLVASETHYPGWQAWVNGAEVPIHRVDIALRGVQVPEGAHRVRMEFHPTILWVGLGISVVTAVFLAWLGMRRPGVN
jgi:hypothetical protein